MPRRTRGDSLGVTTTAAVPPYRVAIGWCAASSTRRPTAAAKATPTAATARTVGHVIRHRHEISAATTTAATATTTAADAPHAMPAAVTAQLVSALGTRRTSGTVATVGDVTPE